MKVYLLKEEKSLDEGISFDAVPYPSMEEAKADMTKRVESFKDSVVREFKKSEFVEDVKEDTAYITLNWSMRLYTYIRIKEFDL